MMAMLTISAHPKKWASSSVYKIDHIACDVNLVQIREYYAFGNAHSYRFASGLRDSQLETWMLTSDVIQCICSVQVSD